MAEKGGNMERKQTRSCVSLVDPLHSCVPDSKPFQTIGAIRLPVRSGRFSNMRRVACFGADSNNSEPGGQIDLHLENKDAEATRMT